jgi:uncharacterized protein YkwD
VNDDFRLDLASEPQTVIGLARASRRRLLALLAVVPAALGLGMLPEPDAADAKKRKNRKKKRKKKGGGGGGGGGGGSYSPDSEERAFLELINDYRANNGAAKLALNNQLGAAAEHHSRDMAKKNYFSHKLSNGDSAEKNIRRFGYTNYNAVGENIAAGNESADETFKQWKNSNGHNKNMLSKNFDEIGIGRAHGKKSKYGWYWTTTFGG